MNQTRQRHMVPLSEAVRYWLRLGFINFGGPAGQIAIMHDELVDKKRWISNERFLHALNYCMLLPGPEAQQLAIYIGWLLNGTVGGIAAGVLFVLPAFFLILALSWTFVAYGDVSWVAGIFYGLQAAVIAIVAAAVIRVGTKALKTPSTVLIALGAFVAIFLVDVPFPLIIVTAAVLGLVAGRTAPRHGAPAPADERRGDAGPDDAGTLLDDVHDSDQRTGWRRPLKVLGIGLLVWWGPLLAVALARGWNDTLTKLAIFFSQAAMVTFGGAYAVLAYIDQAAVERFGWLERGQMVTGLGLAESTPGPLIMVTEFVGYLAAYRFPGNLTPAVAATLGAVVTVWATFAPCFLWIFLGAPYIERLRGKRSLDAALAGVTAAVVGVIANLAVTFAIVALFSEVDRDRIFGMTYLSPDLTSLDPLLLAVAVIAFTGLWWLKWNVLWVVAGSAAVGFLYRTLL